MPFRLGKARAVLSPVLSPAEKKRPFCRQPTKADRLHALAASADAWRGRDFTGSECVDSVRGSLSERLRRLGLE